MRLPFLCTRKTTSSFGSRLSFTPFHVSLSYSMGNHSRIGEPSMPGHFTASRRSLRASSRSSASSPNGGHIDRAIVISADGASQNPCALLLIQLRSLSLEIRVCIRGLCCSSVFQPSYTGIPVSLFFATFPLFSCAHFFSFFP